MVKIKNIIDYEFYSLVESIKDLSYQKLFEKIKTNYKSLNKQTKKILEDYFDKFSFWGSLHEEINDFDEIDNKVRTLTTHIDDFVWLYENLADYTSRHLLFSIINNFVNYDFYNLERSISHCEKHYFDFDLIPSCLNEVFVDLGAYTGDTILDFLTCYSIDCYNKIYCYEITPSIFEYLKKNLLPYKNIILKDKAVQDKEGFIFIKDNIADPSANTTNELGEIKIESVTLDKDIKEKITMIKMDIEGDEEKAILGCKNHIKNDCPILMVSLYHNNDHFWKLPQIIHEYNNQYSFYLRNFGGGLYPTEIVLYAINKR